MKVNSAVWSEVPKVHRAEPCPSVVCGLMPSVLKLKLLIGKQTNPFRADIDDQVPVGHKNIKE